MLCELKEKEVIVPGWEWDDGSSIHELLGVLLVEAEVDDPNFVLGLPHTLSHRLPLPLLAPSLLPPIMCGIFAYCNFLLEKVSPTPNPLSNMFQLPSTRSTCTPDSEHKLRRMLVLILNRIDRQSAKSYAKALPVKSIEVMTQLVSLSPISSSTTACCDSPLLTGATPLVTGTL